MDCYWMRRPVRTAQDVQSSRQRIGCCTSKIARQVPPSQELNDDAKHFTPVGTGTIDWKKIVAVAENERHPPHVRGTGFRRNPAGEYRQRI